MRNYLTEKDIEKMKQEIDYRKVIERKRLIEDVKEARAHGDLSENFEYKAAKRERGKNESRIRYLEKMIKTAKIITDTAKEDEVGLNKQVKVKFKDDNSEEIYWIVTTIEVDFLENKISIESPLGKAIFKKKAGDIIDVIAPTGSYQVEILEVKIFE